MRKGGGNRGLSSGGDPARKGLPGQSKQPVQKYWGEDRLGVRAWGQATLGLEALSLGFIPREQGVS